MKPNAKPIICKIIYWYKGSIPNEWGEVYASVHLLVGYNGATLPDFQKMAAELQKTFSQIKDDEIVCGKVFTVGEFNLYSIVVWNGYLPESKYPGWIQYPTARCEYRW
jgi:hypothetical protein